MTIDLHTHTNFSDGQLSPRELVERAAGNGLRQLAITDHDSTDALDQLEGLTLPPDLQVITGVEISTLWEKREIHILGLQVDRRNAALSTLLKHQQGLRRERLEAIDLKLQRAGVTGLMTYLDTLPCRSLSRNHAAGFLMSRGLVGSKQQAFKKWLGSGGRIHSQAHWCSMETAIEAIRGAGGLTVLAHPSRYGLSNTKLRKLAGDFAAAGGEGIEVSYSNLNPDKMGHLAALCDEHSLWASAGSDFHSPAQSWMDIGRIRELPARCLKKAIWHHPAWESEHKPERQQTAALPG